jgi:hypothetical protein
MPRSELDGLGEMSGREGASGAIVPADRPKAVVALRYFRETEHSRRPHSSPQIVFPNLVLSHWFWLSPAGLVSF